MNDKTTRELLSRLGEEGVLGNPVSTYRFLKNSISFTATTIQLINNQAHIREMVASSMEARPEEADLEGAATALFRLQDTYQLSAANIADGAIPGATNHSAMSADDCFHLGYSAAQAFDFYHSLDWLREAEARQVLEDTAGSLAPLDLDRTFNKSLLFDYLAYSAFEQGNPEWATHYGRKLKDIDPTYPAVDNLQVYEEQLKNRSSTWDGKEETLPSLVNGRNTDNAYLDYEALCRGEGRMPEAQRKLLFCFYRRDTPFTFIAPFKVELLHRSPDIFIFYEALSEREVSHLQDLARPQLKRAMVVKDEEEEEAKQPRLDGSYPPSSPPDLEDGEGNIIASYRIAQNMWVEDYEDHVVDAVSNRVEAMTGLSVEYAENLQIANYGLGGHYEPHYDMTTEETAAGVFNEDHGNRIATVLFYFNQPETGGFTVFEELNLALKPVARSAVFWHNVLLNGQPDMLTRHAACPVLYGAKWVANKWLHEYGQEFIRPCGKLEAVTQNRGYTSTYLQKRRRT